VSDVGSSDAGSTDAASTDAGLTELGTQARSYVNVVITGCEPLVDHASSATVVQVQPTGALAGTSLACQAAVDGGTTGTVTAFDVVPQGTALPPSTGLACRTKSIASFTTGVAADTCYAFLLEAYENGATVPTQEACCYATARSGVSVVAAC